jgi:hypothetical protein
MGGAYLTLLNTIANMGIILPKIGLFAAMDWLTVSSCRAGGPAGAVVAGLQCPKKIRELTGSNACTNAGEAATAVIAVMTASWFVEQCTVCGSEMACERRWIES